MLVTPFVANKQLFLICNWLLLAKKEGITVNPKLLRDIFDVAEGCLRGHLTGRGTYSHAALKRNCSYVSCNAKKSRNKKLHREHAIPVKEIVNLFYKSKIRSKSGVRKFLKKHLVSVIVTQREKYKLDKCYKDKMPENWCGQDQFFRLKKLKIKGNW